MELENIVDEEMLTVEDVNEMLAHTDKGRTRQTIRNCVTVLQKDPVRLCQEYRQPCQQSISARVAYP